MNVLDPVEVCYVEVWPLPHYQDLKKGDARAGSAKAHLDALEYTIFRKCIEQSVFKAILNEKDPPGSNRPYRPAAFVSGKGHYRGSQPIA